MQRTQFNYYWGLKKKKKKSVLFQTKKKIISPDYCSLGDADYGSPGKANSDVAGTRPCI